MGRNEILKLFEISVDDVLHNVILSVCSGEILGVVGETAAGKSCLADIISGRRVQTSGDVFFYGEKISQSSLRKITARADKTDRIISELSVAENVFLGDMARFEQVLMLDRYKLHYECRAALYRVGLSHISPEEGAFRLRAGERKLIELARLLQRQPKIIVLDEFFLPVCRTYRERLVKVLNKYKGLGGAVVFTTRDIDLAKDFCDEIVFIKDGSVTRAAKSSAVVIKTPERIRKDVCAPSFDVLLRATNLCDERLNNVNFKLFGGEMLGVLGRSSCELRTLGRVLFGDIPLERGRITVGGHFVKSVKGAMRRKMAYAYADFDFDRIVHVLDSDAQIFILDGVLYGLDECRRRDILSRINNICRKGGGVIYLSEDVDEEMSVCDRIIILSRGETVGEFTFDEYDKQQIVDKMIR